MAACVTPLYAPKTTLRCRPPPTTTSGAREAQETIVATVTQAHDNKREQGRQQERRRGQEQPLVHTLDNKDDHKQSLPGRPQAGTTRRELTPYGDLV